MGRPPVKVTARALEEVDALAARARAADARAAAEWAQAYDAIARLTSARELTAAAAAQRLGISEAKLNRHLADRRRKHASP